MRGEHDRLGIFVDLSEGSSPHARGTLGDVVWAYRRHGIIPACAGNTESTSARTARTGDHPRIRGEHYS